MDINDRTEGTGAVGRAESPAAGRLTVSTGWMAVLVVLVVGLFYPDVVLGGRTFVHRDFGLFGYPLAYFHRESFWQGEVPFWNPLNCCGLPFLAQWNTMTLYPGSLIYLLLPLPWSLNAFCLCHLVLAGLSMFWLARRWVGASTAAAVAGLAYAVNGLSVNSLMWPNNVAALAWMPLVLLVVEEGWRAGGRPLLLAVLVGGLQMLTGAPEIILFTWMLAAGWLIVDACADRRGLWTRVRRFALVILGVSGLAAAQLLPFLDLLRRSHRDAAFAGSEWSMPLSGWANLFVPLFRTVPAPSGVCFQPGQYWTSSYYVGVGILALAGAAAIGVRRLRVAFLAGLAGLGLVLALGERGLLGSLAEAVFPPLRVMRFPVKFLVLPVFALPLLAAFGFRHLVDGLAAPPARRRVICWLFGSVTAVVGIVVVYAATGSDAWSREAWNGLVRIAALAILLGFVFLLGLRRPPQFQRACLIAILVAHALDVLTHAPRQNPTAQGAVLRPGLINEQVMQPLPRLGVGRALTSAESQQKLHVTSLADASQDYVVRRLGLMSNCNLLDAIASVSGFYSLYLREANQVRFVIAGLTNYVRSPLLDFLGVSQMTRAGSDLEWEPRAGAMPLVTMGQQPVIVENAVALRMLASVEWDPARQVLLPPECRAAAEGLGAASGKVLRSRVAPNRLEAEVDLDRAGLVVVAHSFYPRWRAFVDEREVPLLRANVAFVAVPVPAGRHLVQLRYFDPLFTVGLGISMVTLAVLGVAWVRGGDGQGASRAGVRNSAAGLPRQAAAR